MLGAETLTGWNSRTIFVVHKPATAISAGTSPFIWIDYGNDEPGMTLQRLDGRVWVDYEVDGEVVVSPVKIEKLPPGRYRLKG